MIQINSNSPWFVRVLITCIVYVFFWLVFYGLLFAIPDSFFEVNNIPSLLTLTYIFVFVPWLSFFMYKLFRNKFYFRKNIFLTIHIIYLILSLCLFFTFFIPAAMNFGGF